MFSNLEVKKIVSVSSLVYIYISILLYLLFIISPVTSLMLNTPLYSFQKYLGVIGALILIIDVLVNKKIVQNNYSYFLYAIVLIAVISSIYQREYGFKNNIFIIVWTTIFISLFYSYSARVSNYIFIKNANRIHNIVLPIWILACILSILSYLFNVGYFIKDNPYTIELTRQGFIENRLFGIFSSVNAASLVSGVLLIVGIYKYTKTKSKYLILTNIILFIYIVLSGSRNVQVAMYMSIFLCSLSYGYVFIKDKNLISKVIKSIISGFVIVGLTYASFSVSKHILAEVPKLSIFKDNKYSYTKIISYYPNSEVSLNYSKSTEEGILNRQDVAPENISNNRIKIWKDYLSLYKYIGFTGLSPANYINYIYHNHKNLYIVDFVIKNDGGKNVDIYKTHNGYLLTYVTTGILGVLAFLSFILCIFKDFISMVINKNRSITDIIPTAIIVTYLLTAILFDRSYLFYNDILSCVFWLAIGYFSIILNKFKN